MGKIALLVSREEMLHQAHNILQEKKFQVQQMKVIETGQAVAEARRSMAEGASIIIARGLQASLIKQYTEIPVVEIVLTAQEMALLVVRAKQILDKERPVIAVIGFPNMFCDMSYFDELYGIELRTYFADQGNELSGAADRAVKDGVDLMIGGDTVVSAAKEAGVPSLFLSMTEDSMRQAFAMAENMDYAMSLEKKSAAQIETLLDYSFGGIIRLDASGHVTAVNSLIEEISGCGQQEWKGKPITALAPSIGEDALRQVLQEGKDYSLFLEWRETPVFAVMAPVLLEERVEGAIITCHKMKRNIPVPETRSQRAGGQREALPPLMRFEDVLQHSKAMQACVRQAGLYALSEHPMALFGETGTELRMLAESIHNAGRRSRGPFLEVSLEGLLDEAQRDGIFGERGAASAAGGGTLLLWKLESLTAANQDRLCRMIRTKLSRGNGRPPAGKADVRVIAVVGQPLFALKRLGKISDELYYLFSGLELSVPPLRERKEDLRQKIQDTLELCSEQYSRFHVLTEGAREVLLSYAWEGNHLQLDSFFERLVLTAEKRSLDEVFVRRLLKELYPPETEAKEPVLREELPEGACRIVEALRRQGGNRERAAEELKISKATLWRRMKKYGIEIK